MRNLGRIRSESGIEEDGNLKDARCCSRMSPVSLHGVIIIGVALAPVMSVATWGAFIVTEPGV